MILLAVLPILLEWILGLLKSKAPPDAEDEKAFQDNMKVFGGWLTYLQTNKDKLNALQAKRVVKAQKLYDKVKAASLKAGINI